MANRGYDEWEADTEVYSERQVEGVLLECGLEIESETGTHFLCLCPFHNNIDSAALAVDKEKGLWTCFNPTCLQAGTLEDIPKRLLKSNVFQAKRMILKYKDGRERSLMEIRKESLKHGELPTFDQGIIDKMHDDFFGSPAEEYMKGRGFSDDTMKFFKIGYSAKKNTVATPMYASLDQPVGVIGRRLPPVDFKYRFENSTNLPKKEIPWNIHNAKTSGETLVICEANFDAMSIHQAGYPNVVALLGGALSPWHIKMIDKYFSTIVIMTDFDDKQYVINCKKCKSKGHRICDGHRPGRELGRNIAKQFSHKRVRWAAYDDTCVFPHGLKDANALLEARPDGELIRDCLRNTISNFEYNRWNIEETLAS